jgi:hypothetical protein
MGGPHAVHETATGQLVAEVTSSLLGDKGGLHAGHHTDGIFEDASQWVRKKGEGIKKGVDKFRADRTFAWKKSMLRTLNDMERRSERFSHSAAENREELRLWWYSLLIAELKNAKRNGNLTEAEMTRKQESIDNLERNWRLWNKEVIEASASDLERLGRKKKK